MLQPGHSARAEWAAHWPTVVAAMLGMSFYSMFTYSFGVFIEPLQHEFHWSRANISIGYTIYALSPVILGPFMGALIDIIGTRKIAIWGVFLSALAYGAFSLNNGSLGLWLALWGCLSLTAVLVKTTVWGAAISSIFSKSRGIALAAVLSGSALAQSVAPVVGNWLIAQHGWRFAYQAIAVGWGGLALVLVVSCFFDAREPRKQAARPVGAPAPDTSGLPGLTTRQAIRSPAILRIGFANLIMALVGAGITVHLFEVLVGTGLSRASVGQILITQGIAGIAGKLVTGWLLDRFQGGWIAFTSYFLQAVANALLLYAWHAPVVAALAVLCLGYSAGAGLQVTTYLCSRYAGLRNFGKIYGTIGSMLMLGSAFGPIIAGRVFDVFGSYHPLLVVSIPVVLFGAALMSGLGPYPRFDGSAAAIVSKVQA
jgi:predicted MFS family arabinose efflux permease